jgi:hypothetical protein
MTLKDNKAWTCARDEQWDQLFGALDKARSGAGFAEYSESAREVI